MGLGAVLLRTLREVARAARTAIDVAGAGLGGLLHARARAVVDHAAGGLAVTLRRAGVGVTGHMTADVAGLGSAMFLAHENDPSFSIWSRTIPRLASW